VDVIVLPSVVVQERVWLFATVVAVNVPATALTLFPLSNPFATASPVVASIITPAVTSINLRIEPSLDLLVSPM